MDLVAGKYTSNIFVRIEIGLDTKFILFKGRQGHEFKIYGPGNHIIHTSPKDPNTGAWEYVGAEIMTLDTPVAACMPTLFKTGDDARFINGEPLVNGPMEMLDPHLREPVDMPRGDISVLGGVPSDGAKLELVANPVGCLRHSVLARRTPHPEHPNRTRTCKQGDFIIMTGRVAITRKTINNRPALSYAADFADGGHIDEPYWFKISAHPDTVAQQTVLPYTPGLDAAGDSAKYDDAKKDISLAPPEKLVYVFRLHMVGPWRMGSTELIPHPLRSDVSPPPSPCLIADNGKPGFAIGTKFKLSS